MATPATRPAPARAPRKRVPAPAAATSTTSRKRATTGPDATAAVDTASDVTVKQPTADRPSRTDAHRRAWTPQRRDAIEQYVTALQRSLRLTDWTITVDWSKPCPKDALAAVTPMGDSKHVTLRLSEKFLTEPAQLRTQILVHELVHCYLFAIDDLATNTIGVLAGKKVQDVYEVAHRAALETTVDHIADAIAGLVPPLTLS